MIEANNGRRLFIFVAFLSLGLAQMTSWLIETNIARGTTHRVTSFFYMTHVRNLGGIFGIMQGKGWLFAAIALVLLVGLMIYVLRSEACHRFEYICFGLVFGGGVSNILDRLIYGSVIDFIDIKGIPYWKYIFNVADVFIHLGIWPLILSTLFFRVEPEPEPVPVTYDRRED